MRILLLSDIHANLEALEAVLDAAPAYDEVVNLGDIVGYGASPNEVCERSRQLGRTFVRGNHDKACAGLSNAEDFNPVAAMAAAWTQRTLTEDNLAFVRDLPPGPVMLEALGGEEKAGESGPDLGSVQIVHGSPLDEDEYLIVIRDAMEPLMRTGAALTFFGHTHIQGGFALDGDARITIRPIYDAEEQHARHIYSLQRSARYLLNPGSVGQPRDGDWRAAFALFDSDEYSITYYRIPYDVERAQQRILDAQLPQRLAMRLAEGR